MLRFSCYNRKSMSKITKYLNQLITGNAFDAPEILEAYATDQSALKINPRLVVLPESTSDLQKLMRFFDQLANKNLRVPVAVRGSGLDEMGADLSTGVVISTEKLNRLEEIDKRERLVRVQAGITLKELNTALLVSGMTIPIKANPNETIGSLIANCPNDSYSAKYGGIRKFVERIEIVLPNGERIQTGRHGVRSGKSKTLEASIYKKLDKLVKENPEVCQKISDGTPSKAGYPNTIFSVKKSSIDLMPLMFGSEGTLGIISEVILHAELLPPKPTRLIATFSTLKSTFNCLNKLAKLQPLELNVFDLRILKIAEERGKNLAKITRKLENGYVILVSFNDGGLKTSRKVRQAIKALPSTANYLVENEDNATIIDEFENSIENYINSSASGERVPLLSNFTIPSAELVSFVKDLSVLEQKIRLDLPIFGSFITSTYSTRPSLRISEPNLEQRAAILLKTGDILIQKHGGALAGGYPEGRVKSIITNDKFSKEEKAFYQEIKAIFDPKDILGADAKLGTDKSFTLKHLRTTKTPKIML